jgi:hypothetical protein
MKRVLIAASVALCFTASTFAQEQTGDTSAFGSTIGAVTAPKVVAGVATLMILGGINANGNGTTAAPVVIAPEPTPEPVPSCNGSDPLVDGVCTGTTTTLTVTGTGTMTSTITVPATFTYVPTV